MSTALRTTGGQVVVSGTPSSGQVLTATAPAAANWQTPAAASGGSRIQQRMTSMGLGGMVWDIDGSGATVLSLTPTSKQVYGTLCGFFAGDVITNLHLQTHVAAAGTGPTGIYAAVYSTAGVQLAVSGNENGNTGFLTKSKKAVLPMLTPYTVPSNTALYLCFLQDSTTPWGTTAMQLCSGWNDGNNVAIGSNPTMCVKQTAQTTPPAPATFAVSGENLWLGWS